MNEPIYCGLAFGSASINVRGDYIPCCGIVPSVIFINEKTNKTPIEHLNSKALVRVRESLKNGIWHPACGNCKKSEEAGVSSMRVIWNKAIKDAPLDTIIDPDNVKYLDLSFGSKCNSKCMTCSEGCSDLWVDEVEYIHKRPVRRIDPIAIKQETASQLLDTFKKVEYMSFIGGEPTILDEHYYFIKNLVDTGLSKNISISYVTNLTGISDKLIEQWKHFKDVGASVSIDGYDKVNEYIRYPIKWDKVEENLRRYLSLKTGDDRSFGVVLSCTVSLLNIIHVPDILEFWVDLSAEYDNNNTRLLSAAGAFLNRVTFPEYLNSNLLSVEYRSRAIEKTLKLKEKIKDMDVNSGIRDSVDLLLSWLEEPQVENKKLIKEALFFIESSDTFRNRTIKDYLPEVWEELNRLS